MSTLLKIVTEPPRSLQSAVPEVPFACAAVVDGALVRDRAARVATAWALREQLVAAWTQHGGLADHAEVARWVAKLSGEKLSELDREVARVLEMRQSRQQGARLRLRETPSVVPQVAPQRRRVRPLIAGGALVASAAVLVIWINGTNVEPTSDSTVPTTTQSLLRMLTVTSPVPLVSLSVDDRAILLAGPTQRVVVQLPAEHRTALSVRAQAKDGRQVEVQSAPGSEHLELVFTEHGNAEKRGIAEHGNPEQRGVTERGTAEERVNADEPGSAEPRITPASKRRQHKPVTSTDPGLAPTPYE
jgi:hypothetical protein